jgi:hypothetical protein
MFDREGRFLAEAGNPETLIDRPEGWLVGRWWRDIVPADASIDHADFVWETLRELGRVDSVFAAVLPDGSIRTIEYHTERTVEPDLFVSYWRALDDDA